MLLTASEVQHDCHTARAEGSPDVPVRVDKPAAVDSGVQLW